MNELMNPIFTVEQIRARVKRLAQEITLGHQGQQIELVGLMNGALVFMADLIRHLDFNFAVQTVRVRSYTQQIQGQMQIHYDFDPRGKNLLLIDDILDTGNSFLTLTSQLKQDGAAEVKTCVLLDKAKSTFKADYTGFLCPDLWVIGYGMDHQGFYRNLPFIAELPPSLR